LERGAAMNWDGSSPAGTSVRAGMAAALLSLGAAVTAACPLPAPSSGEHHVAERGAELLWRAQPEPLAVGRAFTLLFRVCPASARVLRVDATMPEHRHGMNYRPSVQALGDGRWRAEGLLWHMAGRWELAFEVELGGDVMWLRQSVSLK
jgi:hypothetical protein